MFGGAWLHTCDLVTRHPESTIGEGLRLMTDIGSESFSAAGRLLHLELSARHRTIIEADRNGIAHELVQPVRAHLRIKLG